MNKLWLWWLLPLNVLWVVWYLCWHTLPGDPVAEWYAIPLAITYFLALLVSFAIATKKIG